MEKKEKTIPEKLEEKTDEMIKKYGNSTKHLEIIRDDLMESLWKKISKSNIEIEYLSNGFLLKNNMKTTFCKDKKELLSELDKWLSD